MAKTKQNKASTKRGTRSTDSCRSRSKTPTNSTSQDGKQKYPIIEKILQMPVKASKIKVSDTPVLCQTTINPLKVKQFDRKQHCPEPSHKDLQIDGTNCRSQFHPKNAK